VFVTGEKNALPVKWPGLIVRNGKNGEKYVLTKKNVSWLLILMSVI